MILKHNFVDILAREIYPALIEVENNAIKKIEKISENCTGYFLPGFIDSHVHVESSLIIPSEFARMAVVHGTVATVSDPHEIANVLGMEGVLYMIENGKKVPFHFIFGAPSCVPATMFETAGAVLNSDDVEKLLSYPDIYYLAEMMNFPGVLNGEVEVLKKIDLAKKFNKPIDGHAPGLRGEMAQKYIDAGINTDHEAYTYEEGLDKLKRGMKILIREGSAAKNFDALIPLVKDYSNMIMFCSDDKHPDSLLLGHINTLVAKAVQLGYDVFDVLKCACINPVEHYKIPVGLLKEGKSADFIVVENLQDFKVLQTYIQGKKVADNGESLIKSVPSEVINNFNVALKNKNDFHYLPKDNEQVIECVDGQLITNTLIVPAELCTTKNDVLKLVVVNRYSRAPVATCFIKNFGLKKGAIASSVAHDSHNIIAVGVNDEEICNAVNLVIKHKGGLSAVNKKEELILSLPVAGLMSNNDAWKVAADYTKIDDFSKNNLGSTLKAPFMSLSFMALLVIPSIKLSDLGLFDGNKFEFI
ncbi:MAG: adenine deaminase [Bacteroidota bacterium]